MQSFDTKDSNTLESFDRKFESSDTFRTKDSEVKQSDNEFVESFDRKFESFSTKDPELEKSDNEAFEGFDRKFESTDEEALPDSKSFGTFSTKDSRTSIPNFDRRANLDKNEQSITLSNCACSGSENSNVDGRCKPRSQKQIETYKRNFMQGNLSSCESMNLIYAFGTFSP